MKRLLAVLFVAAAATGFAKAVSAETWSPTGPVTLSSTYVQMFDGINYICGISGSGMLSGSEASITNLEFTPGMFFLCPFFSFQDLPYNLEPSGLNSVTLQNVRLTIWAGTCAGDLVGAFDQATGRITFDNATLPPDPPGSHPNPCLISGVVETTPQASYTIP